MPPDWDHYAIECLRRLVPRDGATITYGELAAELGIHPRTQLRHALGRLRALCAERGAPLLNAIVVNKRTGLPSEGVLVGGVESIQDRKRMLRTEIARIRRFPGWKQFLADMGVAPAQVVASTDDTRPPADRNERFLQLSGTPGERMVYDELQQHGFTSLKWVGDTLRLGYDIVGHQGRRTMYVEVKSSTGRCVPTLTASEWRAAQRYGERYILAIVDYVGRPSQKISYVRPLAGHTAPRESASFTFARSGLHTRQQP